MTSARTYQGGTDITRFDYTFDANGYNIARQKLDHRPSDPCNIFSYDDLDRLLSAQYGVDESNEVFTIDDLGNRSKVNLRDTADVNYVIDNLTNRYPLDCSGHRRSRGGSTG